MCSIRNYVLLFYLSRIHPRDKTTIGKRLALAGLSMAYGKKMGQFQGPFPSSYEISHNPATLTIIYDFNANKIQQRNSDGFEVCLGFLTILIIKAINSKSIETYQIVKVSVVLKFHNNEIKKLHISRPYFYLYLSFASLTPTKHTVTEDFDKLKSLYQYFNDEGRNQTFCVYELSILHH